VFFLTSSELDDAFSAIEHHGYSAMLPDPPEWKVVSDRWTEVRSAIEGIDLDTYTPNKVMRVFAPKNRANIRVTHLLHPQDLLIYTALVLIVKDDIESSRISKRSQRVFSYRAEIGNNKTLYGIRGAYDKYREQLTLKAQSEKFMFVGVADIADFYPRIYQHRLENIIETVANSQRIRDVARVLVKKLISHLMERNSYGIPVGPYASRLLGEAILIDVDSTLEASGANFVRWVDDYNIFCKTEHEAQAILFTLGECLFTNHGLTLQSAKTKIFPVDQYKVEVLHRHEAQLTGREAVVDILRNFSTGYEGYEEDEPEEHEIEETLALLQAIDLKGILERSLEDTALVDYEAVSYVLKKIPRIPGVSSTLKRQILDLIIDNIELLYPVAEQISHYVLSFDDLTKREKKNIAKKLLKPLKVKKNKPPAFYAMWILSIFSSGAEWGHAKEILPIYLESISEVIKRYAVLAIHVNGNRAEAVAVKDDYSTASPLLKMAILFLSRKLGQDERKHWKLSNGVSGGVEKLI
jgi:hypothetical protein